MLVPLTGELSARGLGAAHHAARVQTGHTSSPPPLTLSLPAHLGFLAVKLGSFRKELMGWTDKRVGLMSEIISGIQMIKFYAWEGAYREGGRGGDIQRVGYVWEGRARGGEMSC